MKKILITLICLLLFLSGCSSEKNLNGTAECVNSIESNNFYNLSIIANQKEIENKEDYALHLIEKVRNNDFKKIMFSYDLSGYPTGVEMDVYLTQEDKDNHVLFMKVSFQQENFANEYNIVDHYEKFTLKIN